MRFILIVLLLAACGPPPQEPGPPAAALAPECADLEADPEPDGPLADDEEVAEAQQARAEMALPSDEATVREIMETTEPEDWSFPFPHTQAEMEELERRNGAADHAGEVRAWAQREAPDSFAGLWIDQAAGGMLTVAFAEDADRYRDAVHDRFGTEVAVVEAAHPFTELERVAEELRGDPLHDSDGQEGTLTAWGIRETINRVTIDVLAPDDELLAELSERYGVDRICFNIEPIRGEEDAQVATWWPAPDADVSPEAVEIEVLVNERACASGQDAEGRIAPPEVDYRNDAVVVTIRVIPEPGPQTCPSNPDTPYTLTLAEPLGDRELLDGGQDPPAPPAPDR